MARESGQRIIGKTLQVVSLPEVWASLARRPVHLLSRFRSVEPCLYVGRMVGKDQAPIVIMAYVDDLLVATTSESALKTLMTTISSCQRGTLAFPWSKYLSKARLICFVHASGSNVLG